ncbi:MAG: hypothetical protein ABSD29_03355 [Verrucomicrobiota bacterium]|jgi:hypothetical protein
MRTLGKTRLFLAIGALWAGSVVPLSAQTVIYSNTNTDLATRLNTGTYEAGNEILLAGTARYLTYFSFEYWGTASSSSFSAPITATLTFYQMNGPLVSGYPSPGTSFFSESFSVPGPTPRSTFIFTPASDFPGGQPLFIPTSDMTWSIQFSGMGATDAVGVDIYGPPTVGQAYGDYWQNDGTVLSPSWVLLTNTVPMDFAAQMYANQNIPEPSVLVLSLAGGLGILTLVRRLRRRE